MSGLWAIYLREMLILKSRIPMLVGGMSVAPFLYLVAFGFALGRDMTVAGHAYQSFLLPGLVALASMTQAFSIAGEINIARFYWKVFEEIQASPVCDAAFVGGEILAGMTRGLMAAAVVVVFGLAFGVSMNAGLLFWTGVLLNSLVFAALAVALAMVVREHSTQMMLNTFLITPMAFLGGTFFPVDRLPAWTQGILSLLPITHAANIIRAAALGEKVSLFACLVLVGMGLVFFLAATRLVEKARD